MRVIPEVSAARRWRRCLWAVPAGSLLVAATGLVLPAAAGATTSSPRQASASSISATASIAPGNLSIEAPTSLQWIGQPGEWALAPLPVTVVDATGSGDGWSVDAAIGAPSDGSSTLTPTSVLLNGSDSTPTASAGPSASCGAGSTCRLPVDSVRWPAVGSTSPVAIATAARTSGMGAVELPFDAWLNTPATVPAGSWTSRLTVSVETGP